MRVFLFALLVASLHTAGWAGQVVHVSFDDLQDKVDVGYHYPGAYLAGTVVASLSARSAPNLFSAGGSPNHRFPSGATWVSFYWHNVNTIQVLDMQGNVMDQFAPQATEWWNFMELRYDRPMGSLGMWGSSQTLWYYTLDDLSYEIVPEPASLAALVLGLAGLGARMRRRR